VALILVAEGGQNQIAYAPGANWQLGREDVERWLPQIREADVLLLQLEVPLEPLAILLQYLPPEKPLVILDPAPAQDLSPLPLARVDYLVPNREEVLRLAGGEVTELSGAARLLLAREIRYLVIKADQEGAYLAEPGGMTHFPAYKVRAVDTTAAGDAFNAALAVALAQGKGPYEAIGYANAAAALTVTKRGASSSLPTREEVQEFLRHPYRHSG
jgi:ribokinase